MLRSTALAVSALLALAAHAVPAAAQEARPVYTHALTGGALVKADGLRARQPYALQLHLDLAAQAFLAMDEENQVYGGRLAPKGKKGARHTLYLDAASSAALFGGLAERAAAAAGLDAAAPFAGNARIQLDLRPDGSARLRIRCEVLTDALGTVVFKAALEGGAPPPAGAGRRE